MTVTFQFISNLRSLLARQILRRSLDHRPQYGDYQTFSYAHHVNQRCFQLFKL